MKIFKKTPKGNSVRPTAAAIFYGALLVSLILAFALASFQGNWQSALLAVVTVAFLLSPFIIEWKMKIYVPTIFSFLISAFLYATIILGQIDGYYTKYWWWDVMLHSGLGLAFGLIGLIVLLILFKRGKINAKPLALCFFAFCFALAIGLLWEVVEFTGDEIFHTDMQHRETGVADTMKDEIMDTIGAALGAALGYLYLRDDVPTAFDELLDRTIRRNRPKVMAKK